jgi:hypothetical protein
MRHPFISRTKSEKVSAVPPSRHPEPGFIVTNGGINRLDKVPTKRPTIE